MLFYSSDHLLLISAGRRQTLGSMPQGYGARGQHLGLLMDFSFLLEKIIYFLSIGDIHDGSSPCYLRP